MTVLRGKARQLTEQMRLVRVLPQVARRHLGPFVFLDHFGPATIGTDGMDVRPHPHIGLSTLTVLYEGAVRHRDSLGSDQWIHPGGVNWMTAGRGITHSERSEGYRGPIHGLQFWVALPEQHQEAAPSFQHHPADAIPRVEGPDHRLSVVVGPWQAHTSPVATHGSTTLVLAELDEGGTLALPDRPGEEFGVFVVDGAIRGGGEVAGPQELWIPATAGRFTATRPSRLAILGGRPVGHRHMAWNFVHSDPARVERAMEDWRQQRFPVVPGDEVERIPLP